MKQLSQQHPKPNQPFYTVMLSPSAKPEQAAYYHLVKAQPDDPSSVDVIYMFNDEKNLIGMQVPIEPNVIPPAAHMVINAEESISTYKLNLGAGIPMFPKYQDLVKLLNKLNEPVRED